MILLRSIHHVQLAMPEGGEDQARAFYTGLLHLNEKRKPDNLVGRGGCWFEAGEVRIHLGIETAFRPALKAHPAFEVEDVAAMAKNLTDVGCRVVEDEPLENYHRVYVHDPFGNRIELIEFVGSLRETTG